LLILNLTQSLQRRYWSFKVEDICPVDDDIGYLEEIKEDIPFNDEITEITDSVNQIHASEHTFPVAEYNHEHPCIELFVPDNEVKFFRN
jgi:hypothetical protein